MTIRVVFEISPRDLQRFRTEMRRARRRITGVATNDILAAAEKGVRAILCEKPLGLDLQEADRMIEACEKNDVLLATNHHRRFGPQHILAKQLLKENIIGPLRMVIAECPRDILRALLALPQRSVWIRMCPSFRKKADPW